MGESARIELETSAATLRSLSEGLKAFGSAEGSLPWLVRLVWLCTDDQDLLVVADPCLLPDGRQVCTLSIDTPARLFSRMRSMLPPIESRLREAGYDASLPQLPDSLPVPTSLEPWTAASTSLAVLERRASREPAAIGPIACGLLFTGDEQSRLLVATSGASVGILLTEDAREIDQYLESCAAIPANDYACRLQE